MKKILLIITSIGLFCQFAQSQDRIPESYKLIYAQDFDSPQAINDFEMTDKRAWKVDIEDEGRSLELFGQSEYKARVRSPFNIALLKDVMVGDFVLEANLAQSGKEYGHRDLCLFFNVKDATNYYYVHIASVTDDHANNIFIVNDEPRVKISSKTNAGNDWGEVNSWHKVRIERSVADGTIKIYFDDMVEPIMEATDTHFVKGRIGFGSFDDTGRFDKIKIWAPERMQTQKAFSKVEIEREAAAESPSESKRKILNLTTRSVFLLSLLLLTVIGCTDEVQNPDVRTAIPSDFDEAEEVSAVLADGFELDLWAPGPLLSNAVALTFDDLGNAYVAETSRRKSSDIDIRQHRDWMVEDLSLTSMDESRAFHLKKLATNLSGENDWLEDHNEDGVQDYKDLSIQSEYIRRVWDSDGDGRADKSQLFAADINQMLTGVAAGVLHFDNEIYVTAAPDVFKYSDKDNDGQVDDRINLISGFGIHIAYAGHDMSGLTVGHDGKIYWSIGDMGVNVTDANGKAWSYPHEGAIMRCNPDGSDFEVFAHGLRNPQEIDFDAFGNLISVDNDGDHKGEHERYVHVIEGSDSGWRIHWQYGKYHLPNEGYKVWTDEKLHVPHFENQAAYLLPPIALAYNGPAGLAFNPGTALGQDWNNYFFASFFTANSANSKIQAFNLKPKGASFEVDEIKDILSGIVPTGITFAGDGALYLNDWKDSYAKKPEGRIWKLDVVDGLKNIERKVVQSLIAEDFKEKTIEQLKLLIANSDKRIRLKSQFELVKRNQKNLLLSIAHDDEFLFARLHAIWGLGQLARKDNSLSVELFNLLDDTDAHVRAQVAKVIGDAKNKEAFDRLTIMLNDQNAKVRFFTVEALGKLRKSGVFDKLVELLANVEDTDLHMRHAIVYALSKTSTEAEIASLINHRSRFVRLGAVVALRHQMSSKLELFLSDSDEYVVLEAARAINDDKSVPDALHGLASLLNKAKSINEALIRRSINANLRLAKEENVQNLLTYALNPNAPVSMREDALWALGYWSKPLELDRVDGSYRKVQGHVLAEAQQGLQSVFNKLLADDSDRIRIAVIETAGRLNCNQISSVIFDVFNANSSDSELRLAALGALASINSEQLSAAINTALDDENQEIREAAQVLLDKSDLEEDVIIAMLGKIISSNSLNEKQKAIATISKFESRAAESLMNGLFEKLRNNTLAPEVSLDVLTAIEGSSFTALKSLKAEFEKQWAGDKISAYSLTKQGGIVAAGLKIFSDNETAQCMRCHATNGEGGEVGPDLSKIASVLTTDQLLESLIEPNKRIAPGYGVVQITKQDGSLVGGVVIDDSELRLELKVGHENLTLLKSEIKEMKNLPSGMFDMSASLSKMQIRDLMAYLKTLK